MVTSVETYNYSVEREVRYTARFAMLAPVARGPEEAQDWAEKEARRFLVSWSERLGIKEPLAEYAVFIEVRLNLDRHLQLADGMEWLSCEVTFLSEKA